MTVHDVNPTSDPHNPGRTGRTIGLSHPPGAATGRPGVSSQQRTHPGPGRLISPTHPAAPRPHLYDWDQEGTA